MERPQTPVKRGRSYDSSRRRERAREQYEGALDAARSLFLDQGYGAVTVEAIAQAAGVSAATIYKTYGGKSGLIRELCRRALQGTRPTPAEERSNALRTATDSVELIEGWAALAAEVSPLVSPLLLLLRAAGQTDTEAASLFEELDQARLVRMTDNARHLARVGHLRPGVSVADARDVLWLSSAPELFELLVLRRRWTNLRFRRYVASMLRAALL